MTLLHPPKPNAPLLALARALMAAIDLAEVEVRQMDHDRESGVLFCPRCLREEDISRARQHIRDHAPAGLL